MGFLGSANIEFAFANIMETTSIEASDAGTSSLKGKGNQYEVM